MKTKNIFKIFLSLLLVSGLVIGCTEDHLDVPVYGSLDEGSYYQTDDQAFEAVVALYDVLQWQYNQWNWSSPVFTQILLSDAVNAGGSDEGDQPMYQQINEYKYTVGNNPVLASWGLPYMVIGRANKILANVEPDSDMKKVAIAETRILRAHAYFDLVSKFGGVPLKTVENMNETHVPRATADAIWQIIESDLNAAIPDIPTKAQFEANNPNDAYRVSKGTAYALLGKALLYQEKYAEAAAAFDQVIQSDVYDLTPDISIVHLEAGEFNDESLFEISYVNTENYDWGTFPWAERDAEANAHTILSGPRVGMFSYSWGTTILTGGWGFAPPTPEIWDAFIADGAVERRNASLISEAELIAAGGGPVTPHYQYEQLIRVKGSTVRSETNMDYSVPDMNYGTNIRLIRYADVLLMAAEAYLRSNNPDRAITELDKVRVRAGKAAFGDATGMTDQDIFDEIVHERQVELAFEGHRFLDLVRWGLAHEELSDRGFKQGTHELFPIPLDEILSNEAITTADQNPGY